MQTSDLVYMLHQIRDVALSIWDMSPPIVIGIFIALLGTAYFVFKR